MMVMMMSSLTLLADMCQNPTFEQQQLQAGFDEWVTTANDVADTHICLAHIINNHLFDERKKRKKELEVLIINSSALSFLCDVVFVSVIDNAEAFLYS